MFEALRERGFSQNSLCGTLALSPVYFSIWLKGKGMPDMTKQLYSAACELWLADPTFVILDPGLTRTNPAQVPKAAKGSKPAGPRSRGSTPPPSGSGGGGGRPAKPPKPAPRPAPRPAPQPASSAKEREILSACSTPLQILEEMLRGAEGREVAFQLQSAQAGSEAEPTLNLVYATLSKPAATLTPPPDQGSSSAAVEDVKAVAKSEMPSDQASSSATEEVVGAVAKKDAPPDQGWSSATIEDVGAMPKSEDPKSDAVPAAAAPADAAPDTDALAWNAVCVTFRRHGGDSPFASMLRNGSLLAPDALSADKPMLAVHERPQRYRKTRDYSETADPQLAEALAESRRTAALQPTAAKKGAEQLTPTELRRQLLNTLQAMSSKPLELRQHKRKAAALAERCPGLQWTAFCSVCGVHFETLSGLHNLAGHAGMHAVHARVNRLRRDELPQTLGKLRTASSSGTERAAGELRSELESARRLSKLLPDAALQRAVVHAEARLRAIDRGRQRTEPTGGAPVENEPKRPRLAGAAMMAGGAPSLLAGGTINRPPVAQPGATLAPQPAAAARCVMPQLLPTSTMPAALQPAAPRTLPNGVASAPPAGGSAAPALVALQPARPPAMQPASGAPAAPAAPAVPAVPAAPAAPTAPAALEVEEEIMDYFGPNP